MTTPLHGLTTNAVKQKRAEYGPNVIEEEKQNPLFAFLKLLISPISLMLIATAILSLVAGRDVDALIISLLFAANIGIKVWHEHKADRAVKTLQSHLAVTVRVLRDGEWQDIESRELVPGDIVKLNSGSVVPADVELVEENNVSINEAALTGESLPVEKKVGDTAYSGSFLARGFATGKVTKTGADTYFGKTLTSVDMTKRRSVLEKDIIRISKFLSAISIVVMIGLTVFLMTTGASLIEILTLDISLLIAGIPVALPTVMSLIMSIGVMELAKKEVVVRRLSSLEDLSNVNLLLSDKTGTLTENKIEVKDVVALGNMSRTEILRYAGAAAYDDTYSAIDQAVLGYLKQESIDAYERTDLVPADSKRKRVTAYITKDGTPMVVSFGAPHTVAELCDLSKEENNTYNTRLTELTKTGARVLAVAVGEGKKEKELTLIGLIVLADRVRADAAEVISFMAEHGVEVKMVTGDTREVARVVAEDIGLSGEVTDRSVFDDERFATELDRTAAYAEVLPEDKLKAVEALRENYVVAVTGDGINDLPAIKAATVGIAVKNAVDALRSTADIVLLSSGIAVIKDAIIESRKVFARVYNYSIYRISESFRLIISIAVIGVWFGTFPLTPVQIILVALLNDIPIVSLAFDRVRTAARPAHINAAERATLSLLFGTAGILNSMLMLLLVTKGYGLPWDMIQTIFFLKLTVSGHMLIYVAHTKELWWRYLPSRPVILATTVTQGIATCLAIFGVFTAAIPWQWAVFIWIWSFFWMQVSELAKIATRALQTARVFKKQ